MFNALPDDLRHLAVSTSTFGQSLETHLFLPISTFSALGVFHVMRYIGLNARYLLAYLLLPMARIVVMGWVRPTNFKRNDQLSSENKTMLVVDPSTTASLHITLSNRV